MPVSLLLHFLPEHSPAVAEPVFPDSASLVALPPLALFCWVWVTLPPAAEELFVALADDTAFEPPDFAVPPVLEPELPVPLLLELPSAAPPPLLPEPDLAPELLLFTALPLFETLWLAEPPLPPTEELLALPELPDFAVDVSAPFSDPLSLLAFAGPVWPDEALLQALPPLALFCWFWSWFPPWAAELLVAEASDWALELPDVALPPVLEPEPDPLPELLESAFASPLLLAAPPELAFELLLLDVLPLPETFWLTFPPSPPVDELLADPELPDVAVAVSESFFSEEVFELALFPLSSLVAVAAPVFPDSASLQALPPLALLFWV